MKEQYLIQNTAGAPNRGAFSYITDISSVLGSISSISAETNTLLGGRITNAPQPGVSSPDPTNLVEHLASILDRLNMLYEVANENRNIIAN